jgi:hypothetical protein
VHTISVNVARFPPAHLHCFSLGIVRKCLLSPLCCLCGMAMTKLFEGGGGRRMFENGAGNEESREDVRGVGSW